MIDLDEIEAGEHSPLYLAIADKYDFMRKQKTASLLEAKPAEETAFLRGYITALADCARIPAQLKAAIVAKRTQNARNARRAR